MRLSPSQDIEQRVLGTSRSVPGTILTYDRTSVEMPNGDVEERDLVRIDGDSVSVVCHIPEDDTIFLVEQYRPSVGTITFELPGGGIKTGEEPVEAAVRELREETGIKVDVSDMHPLTSTTCAPGYSTEVNHSFYCEVDAESSFVGTDFDPDEYIIVHRKSLDDLEDDIFSGGVHDARTTIGILAYSSL